MLWVPYAMLGLMCLLGLALVITWGIIVLKR
jgi:hypothetical protein